MTTTLKSGFAIEINKYLNYRVACGLSRTTDEYMLMCFDTFCAERFPEESTLSRQIAREWIDAQETSIINKSTAIRNFAKYLRSEGHDAYLLPENRRYNETGTFLPHMFTQEELRALFKAINDIKPASNHPRLPIILPVLFRLIYSCGLRPNEGRELLRENINFKTGEVKIINTKKKRERTVVMSDDMYKLCVEYDKQREEFAGTNPYFFPSESGGVFSEQGLQRWLRQCWATANPNVPEDILPKIRVYNLRHVFATTALTRWVESGANIKAKLAYLQAYMGHETIDETMYYVHLLPTTLLSGGKWDTLPEEIL